MPFPAKAIGAEPPPIEHEVSARSILAFAAGIGADEPAFLDDARPEGLSALPFQCVSLEWPCLLGFRSRLERLTPEEAVRGVHVAQDSEFHRPMRPGDRLTTSGQLVSARAVRAGVLTIIRLDTRCALSGEKVTTSWSSSIYRDVALDGEAATLADPPESPAGAADPMPAGSEADRLPIARQAAHVYSECANIWNPIHTERRVALAAGLPDIILHGTATWALAGLALLRRYGDGDGARLRRLSGRFTGMVIPGETITLRHAPGSAGLVRFEVLNGAGASAISEGAALFANP